MSYDSSPDTRQKYTRNCAHSLLKVCPSFYSPSRSRRFCPSFSTLAFSRPIVFFVRHFQVVHFQRHRSLSVRPSVCHKPVLCRNDWTNQAGFGTEVSFHPSHTVLSGNSVISKTRVLGSGTLSRIQDLENFSTSNRSCCQQNSLTVEHVDGTCDRRRTWLLVVVDCVQFVPIVVREIMTAVAELLVSKRLWNKVLHRL